MGEPVGRTHHKVFKGKLGIEVHGRGHIVLFFIGLHLSGTEYDDLGIGIKDFFQSVFNDLSVTAADDFHPELRGGVEDQLFFVQLHHFGVIK